MKVISGTTVAIMLAFLISIVGLMIVVDKDETIRPNVQAPVISAYVSPTPTPQLATAQKVFNAVQAWRVKNNLPEYIVKQEICDYAEIRAEQSVSDWSHDGALKDSTERTDMCPVNTKCRMGENLASSTLPADTILFAWLNSRTHLDNLEADYKYSCIGQYENNFAQIFLDY